MGCDGAVDAELSAAIERTLSWGVATRLAIPLGLGQGALAARIGAIDPLDDDPFQLLRVVAILERQPGNSVSRELRRRRH